MENYLHGTETNNEYLREDIYKDTEQFIIVKQNLRAVFSRFLNFEDYLYRTHMKEPMTNRINK